MSYDVIVKIIADGKKAVAEFDRAGNAADRMAKKTNDATEKAKIDMDKFGRQAGIAGLAMIGAAGTVAYAMKSWVNSAQEAERAHMQLESSVKGAYGASSSAVKAFEAQANAIQKVTVASDEDVSSIQAMLVQFGLTERQVTTLTPLVVDIARKWNIDYVSAAKAVMKSADGKATALKKLGIQVDETKAKTDPYIATVEALRRAAGGFAQQEGKTFAGQTAILKNQMDELKESLGRGVLSTLNDVLPAVVNVTGAFTSLDDRTGGLIGSTTAIGTGFLALSGGALLAFSAITKLKTAYAEAAASSTAFQAAQVGLASVAGAVIGGQLSSSLYQALSGNRDKTAHAFKIMMNTDDGKEAARQFIYAVAGTIGDEQATLTNVAARIAGAFGTFFTLGLKDPYDDVVNRMRAGSFSKVFNQAMAIDPQRTRDIIATIAASKGATDALAKQGVEIGKYVKLTKDLVDANHDGVQSIQEIQAANEAAAQSAAELTAVVSSQGAAARGVISAQLGVRDATKSLADAQTAYNDAVKTGDPTKIADAQAVLQGAMIALAGAQDQAREAAFKHAENLLALQVVAGDTEAYDRTIAKLVEMKNILTDPAEKEAIQERIDALILLRITAGEKIDLNSDAVMISLWRLKAAGQITETQLRQLQDLGYVKFDTTSAVAALEGLTGAAALSIAQIAALRALTDGFGGGVLNTQTQLQLARVIAFTGWNQQKALDFIRKNPTAGRASGGPVAGSTPYLVGEQGPELFVPTGNGMIVPNNKLGGNASTVGATTVNIQVASGPLATPADTGAAVLDALKAYERRNGALPLKVA